MTDNNTASLPAQSFADKITKSSQVCHVAYNANERELHVVFRTNAVLYAYLDFPPEMWAELQEARSIGSFLANRVTRPTDGKLPFVLEKRALPVGFVMPVLQGTSAKGNGRDAIAEGRSGER
jgi:hypothetical protein